MVEFVILVLKTTATQLLSILGIFFLLGFALSKLQEWTQKNYFRSVGWKGILWTAWIGTPIHELGHWFFATLFRHRTTKVMIFSPNEKTGELGAVEHSFNPNSLYQKTGNFFIGVAPMIFGSVVLWTLVNYVLPEGELVFVPLQMVELNLSSLLEGVKNSLKRLFTFDNLKSWQFWLYFYLSICVASHLAPSPADRKGMWYGLVWIAIILLVINAFAVLLKLDIAPYILKINQYSGILATLFVYAIVISALHWLLSIILNRLIR